MVEDADASGSTTHEGALDAEYLKTATHLVVVDAEDSEISEDADSLIQTMTLVAAANATMVLIGVATNGLTKRRMRFD